MNRSCAIIVVCLVTTAALTACDGKEDQPQVSAKCVKAQQIEADECAFAQRQVDSAGTSHPSFWEECRYAQRMAQAICR